MESDTETVPSVTMEGNEAVLVEQSTTDPMPWVVDDIVDVEVLEENITGRQPDDVDGVVELVPHERNLEQVVNVTAPQILNTAKAIQPVLQRRGLHRSEEQSVKVPVPRCAS